MEYLAIPLWLIKIAAVLFVFASGWGVGIITGIKVSPETEEFNMQFAKVKWKVKGKDNTIQDGLDITSTVDITKETEVKEKKGLFKRIRERRQAKKANK